MQVLVEASSEQTLWMIYSVVEHISCALVIAALCRNCHVVGFGAPHSFLVQHHCHKYKSQVCNSLLDVM